MVSPTHDFSTDIPRTLSNHICIFYLFKFFFTRFELCSWYAGPIPTHVCSHKVTSTRRGPRALSTLVVPVAQRLHAYIYILYFIIIYNNVLTNITYIKRPFRGYLKNREPSPPPHSFNRWNILLIYNIGGRRHRVSVSLGNPHRCGRVFGLSLFFRTAHPKIVSYCFISIVYNCINYRYYFIEIHRHSLSDASIFLGVHTSYRLLCYFLYAIHYLFYLGKSNQKSQI